MGIDSFIASFLILHILFVDTHECIKVLLKNLLLVLVREGLGAAGLEGETPLRMGRGLSSVWWTPHTE